ncbi:MAG: hypothetical protein E5V49_03090 [Mesorhizobium sp.]|nr:hypothetical protein EN848_11685 [bacterium M00.F.Ca.ET.205.01.1.1]TGU55400.1 hypothetical protein EN795_01340 [bacterium M00.F.Ca.ET.152.01.1.1]TGV40312.1 hypothetical protein EN829_003100 [Mesorhizobium sp. M00.F.Ca.ET.186.01.1.1]TGZ45305.1 hypothetical protein EN805_03080 [bacterium M00.F.Ca.ET.162.01.1.1]TIW61538.1 MAG: hypothetical protein E5V48_09085 [Mesorhizobium sp.]
MEGVAIFVVTVLPIVVLILSILLVFFIYAVRLVAADRKTGGYPLGIVVVLVAAAILLKPEADDVLRAYHRRQVASITTSSPSSKPPYHLHIIGVSSSGDEAVLALAESGLFQVTTSWGGNEDRFDQRIVVEDAEDCMKRRTAYVQFTAATGFTRCARLIREAGTLPANRLTLWIGSPPLMSASLRQKQRGMQLSEIGGGKESLLAYWETSRPLLRSFVARLLPYGVRDTDTRGPHSMRTSYRTFDPDVLKFVFDGVRIDPAGINVPGQKTPRELAAMISNILTEGPAANADAAIPALGMLGAVGADATETDAALGEIAKYIFDDRSRRLMQINGNLDCKSAEVVVSHRQAASQACSERARQSDQEARKVRCIIPVGAEQYRELCRSGFRDEVWPGGGGAATKVLIAWPNRGYKSDIAIGRWNGGGASVTIVDVPNNHGQLDLALVSQGNQLWYFTGSTGCIARVSVLSPESGVIGIHPDRVHFRFRGEIDVSSLGRKTPLDFPGFRDILGATPDVMLTRAEGELGLEQALATAGSASTACGESRQGARPDVRDESIAVDPKDVVTDPIMIPFKLR